jgi:hypothetical protein
MKRKILSWLAVSLLSVAIPATAYAGGVMSCLKAAGWDQAMAEADTAKDAANFVDDPECTALLSNPVYIALSGGVVALSVAGNAQFSSTDSCTKAPFDAVAGPLIAQTFLLILPHDPSLQAIVNGTADDTVYSALQAALSPIMSPYNCACKFAALKGEAQQIAKDIAAFTGDISDCANFIANIPGLKQIFSAIGSVATSGVDGVEDLIMGSCNPQIPEDQYYNTYMKGWAGVAAMMTQDERNVFYTTDGTGVQGLLSDCIDYYHHGAEYCNMSGDHATSLCEDIGNVYFNPGVADIQMKIFTQAHEACWGLGDGCGMNNPGNPLEIDTYSDDAQQACASRLPSDGNRAPGTCAGLGQPCCKRMSAAEECRNSGKYNVWDQFNFTCKLECPAGYALDNTKTNCVAQCKPGSIMGADGTCTPCGANTIPFFLSGGQGQLNNGVCVQCAGGMQSAQGSTTCHYAHQANCNSPGDCQCTDGYTSVGVQDGVDIVKCVCAADKVEIHGGPNGSLCVPPPPCVGITVRSNPSDPKSACVCPQKDMQLDTSQIGCSCVGNKKMDPNSKSCVACPQGTYTTGSACQGPIETFEESPCPPGTWSATGAQAKSSTGKHDLTCEKCPNGEVTFDHKTCAPCNAMSVLSADKLSCVLTSKAAKLTAGSPAPSTQKATANPIGTGMNTQSSAAPKGSNAQSPAASKTFKVTPAAGPGGTITPATVQTVNPNGTTTFVVKPNAGYQLLSVLGCNGTLKNMNFTTAPAVIDCKVQATFEPTPPPTMPVRPVKQPINAPVKR